MKYQHNNNGQITEREYFSVADGEVFVGTHHHGYMPVGSYVDNGFGEGVFMPNIKSAIYFFMGEGIKDALEKDPKAFPAYPKPE